MMDCRTIKDISVRVNYSFWFALFFALLCPLLNCPLFFALVMPLYMPSTDNLKCPLYILPFFNGMPSLGMLYFQMC